MTRRCNIVDGKCLSHDILVPDYSKSSIFGHDQGCSRYLDDIHEKYHNLLQIINSAMQTTWSGRCEFCVIPKTDHEEHHELLKSQDMYEKLACGRTVEEVCNICTPIRKHYEEDA